MILNYYCVSKGTNTVSVMGFKILDMANFDNQMLYTKANKYVHIQRLRIIHTTHEFELKISVDIFAASN